MRKLVSGMLYDERFNLASCLGAGAFGEVWRAQDVAYGAEVALKILFEDWLADPSVVERFEREVSVLARLQHPGIAQLLDAGRDETSCPYYSMTLVSGTPLNTLPEDLPTILEVFDKLLAALGYAHARGIIHRDLKPDNVLVSSDNDQWECKILDFGIAQLHEPKRKGTECGQVLGTLEYMSPEQASGFARSVGPASDVYSAGVMLYELLSGSVPFEGQGLQILAAHVMEAPPALVLKPGLESSVTGPLVQLVGDMLAKRYSDRPETCGDVRTRLAGILEAALREKSASPGAATVSGGYSSATTNRPSNAQLTLTASGTRLGEDELSVVRMRDPVPAGRAELKAALWEAVQEVASTTKPALAVLSGPAGIGKTRLARWLAEMLHEHGPMRVVRVQVSPRGGLIDALHNAIDRILRSPPMVRRTLRRWIDDVLPIGDQTDRTALCDFLLTQRAGQVAETAETDWVHLSSMVLSKVASFPSARPLLLWVDGPGDEGEAEVAEWLGRYLDMAAGEALPLLIVWSSQAREDDQALRHTLRRIAGRHLAIALPFGPLDLEETAALVKQLTPALSSRALGILHTSSGGNPLVIREVLLAWIERGELEITPEGLDLRTETGAYVPVAANQVVISRLDGVLASAEKGEALSIALMAMAHLGDRISMEQARGLLEKSGVKPSALVRDGVLVQHPNQDRTEFSFANGLLVDTLRDRAQAEGVVPRVLRKASMAALDDGLRAVVRCEWQSAEQNLATVSTLLDELQITTSHPLRLEVLNAFAHIARRRSEGELLDRLAGVMSERALEIDDEILSNLFEATAEHWRGRARLFEQNYKAARRHFRTALPLAQTTSDTGLVAMVLHALGVSALRMRGDAVAIALFQQAARTFGDAIVAEKRPAVRRFMRHSAAETNRDLAFRYAEGKRSEEAVRLLTSVHTAYQELEDPNGEAFALLALARIQRQLGNSGASLMYMHLAVDALAKLEDKRAAAMVSWEEAALALEQGDLQGAKPLFEQASKHFVAVRDQAGHAMCINAFGEVARKSGKIEEALEHYQHFLSVMGQLGHIGAVISAHTNMGWTLSGAERFEEAAGHFQAALAASSEDSPPGDPEFACFLGLARCQTALDEYQGAENSLGRALNSATAERNLDEDAEACFEMLGKMTSPATHVALVQRIAERLAAPADGS